MNVCGQLVDIHLKEIYPAIMSIRNGKIEKIERAVTAPDIYIMPGLIDAHIHIESSMITPGAFATTAVKHGTTGVVSDPHEIANVMGVAGVRFMIEDGNKVPLKFYFGAPSCVPATNFETSGSSLKTDEIRLLLEMPEIKYLSEMMNFPGVINDDKEVYDKLNIARELNKPVDGHAPGLTGQTLRKYISAGISTDHECNTLEEAREKLSLGMKILIREGSAARNLDSLKDLFNTDPEMVMLCSDDLHPDMLQKRHINKIIAGLISEGFDTFDVIRSATINPVSHYNLESGLLQPGQNADFIIVDNLRNMNVLETWIDGKMIYAEGKVLFRYSHGKPVNNFRCRPIDENQIKIVNQYENMRIIETFEGELLTKELVRETGRNNFIEPDTSDDVLKIVVKDRYKNNPPSVGFIKGFGLKKGAFAGSVAHDSHNIIAVGTNDKDIVNSINEIIRIRGGLAVASGNTLLSLRLNIGGIMTTRSCDEVANDYQKLNEMVKYFGSKMKCPFMVLSFMALLVIPDLKIGDKGLFDVKKFEIVPLFVK